ncbi:hypothetical protein BTE77_35480 [Ensifer adhaerens]|nr:hypothetical protein BTE77_35480 [Ensifer adhaerens]
MGVELKMHDDIWNAIIDRKLRPGVKLEEAALGEIYGVSRTVIRKVLVIMEERGLVSLPVNRGAYVATPSIEDAEDLIDALELLACYFVKKIAAGPKDDRTNSVRSLTEHVQMEKKFDPFGDFHVRRRLRLEFGFLLGLLSGNSALAADYHRHGSRLTLALAAFQDVAPIDISIDYSARLAESIAEGNAAPGIELIETFSNVTRRSLRFAATDQDMDLKVILGAY